MIRLTKTFFAEHTHKGERRSSSGNHKHPTKQDSNNSIKRQSMPSATSRVSGGDLDRLLQNTGSSPIQSELSPSSADPPEPEELIKV